jgi:hypothetical protein
MMKQLLYTSFAAALWVSPGFSQSPADRSNAADNPRTITGCVTPGTTSGTFSIAESPAAAAPTAQRGPAASAAGGSWTLKADTSVDLSKYVGKRVELTGSSDRRGGVSEDHTASTTRSPQAMAGPQFHVKSVKVLSETCS